MRPSRRTLLRGLAGFTLALPVLPSLLPRQARADDVVPRRFVAFATDHGGVWQSWLYPDAATLTQSRSYAGHDIRRGDLASSAAGGRRAISAVLSGSDAVLTPALVRKLNVLRGLDVPWYLAHHRGGHLGNYAYNDGNGSDGKLEQGRPRPTIDQVMSWSEAFYPDTSGILERSLVLGGRGMSAELSNPSDATSTVRPVPSEFDSLALFGRIFRRGEAPSRPLVVDRVVEDYRRLRDGDRRLSEADRARLNEHMERLFELERKLSVRPTCGDVDEPGEGSRELTWASGFGRDPDAQAKAWGLLNDVIVAAFVCDSCRVVTAKVDHTFSTFAGDWHQDIAHQANLEVWRAPPATDGPAPHDTLAEAHQRFFEGVFLDLVSKLDAVGDGRGGTLLDACLVQWTHESGPVTHDPIEMPVITAGSAGGALSTGSYADFRNLGVRGHRADSTVPTHVGLLYNQWLGTALEAMGVPRTDFEGGDHGGYGSVRRSTERWYAGYDKYDDRLFDVMGDKLPFV